MVVRTPLFMLRRLVDPRVAAYTSAYYPLLPLVPSLLPNSKLRLRMHSELIGFSAIDLLPFG